MRCRLLTLRRRAAVDGGRVNIAACSVGGGQAALDAARSYAAQRTQFGQPIAAFQVPARGRLPAQGSLQA